MSSEKPHHRSSWYKTGLLAGGMYFGLAAGEVAIGNVDDGFRNSANAEAKTAIHQCRDQVKCTLSEINDISARVNTCATGKSTAEKTDYRPLDTLNLDGQKYEIGTDDCNYVIKREGITYVLRPAAKGLDPVVVANRIKEGVQRIQEGHMESTGLAD